MPHSTHPKPPAGQTTYHTLEVGEELRLPLDGSAWFLTLETNKETHPILLLPRDSLTHPEDKQILLLSMRHHLEGIGGCLLLKPGHPLHLGRKEAQALHFFDLVGNLPQKPLTLRLEKDALSILKNNDLLSCRITPAPQETAIRPILANRAKNLARLRQEVLSGTLPQILPPEKALDLLKTVNGLLARDSFRPPDDLGEPGAVVTLPSYLTPLLVGDLHAQVDNLLLLLTSGRFLDQLLSGQAVLVLLGDAVHREEEGFLTEMDSSLLMMDLILQLKRRMPNRVFYLRGNHDTFSPTLSKRGIPQGALWEKHLLEQRGEAYCREMAIFQRRLPLIAVSPHFLACHAGPIKAIPTLDLMINANRYPALARELTSNRPMGPANLAGYSLRDVRRFRLAFGLPPEVPFVVGHTPLSHDMCFWREAGQIPFFHVLHGAHPNTACLLAIQGHRLFPFHMPRDVFI